MNKTMTMLVESEIEWASLDLFGHVNNVAFFFFVQKARLRFCEQIGLSSLNESGKLGFIVASSHCDYIKPLFYPGRVQIKVEVSAINNSSFALAYQIMNQANVLSASAKDVLVLFDYQKRQKVYIDEMLREQLTFYKIT